ncbi:hypothetical protein Taro_022047 [Colocasia esculenta]|uniref:Beta-glucosidase n=1 Tax=Colocasia esculenta TaxID=4460 RepID=A0A843V2V2_COLES|nr:hypothetical protein [Colocasia esculenta]
MEPFIAAHNMVLAHLHAVETYRKHYQSEQGGKIGIAVHAIMYEPLRDVEDDRQAARRKLAFNNAWFLDPLVFGDYPREMRSVLGSRLPRFTQRESQRLLKAGLDFVGVNHYTTLYAKDCMHSSPCESGGSAIEGFVYVSGESDGIPIGEQTACSTFYVVPDGMERLISYLKRRYNNTPMFLAENGYAQLDQPNESVEILLNDYKRMEYHRKYLAALANAMRDGADVRGYFVWSLLDNFEWLYGYTRRFGLYHVDYTTLKRTPKLSAKWYRDFLANSASLIWPGGERGLSYMYSTEPDHKPVAEM